ncbi:hypothetical protein Btru_061318 [Bulinus truncatus]|nr:hypothetical protein Btru_061318 [Bulinus truncatus]
MFPIVKKKDGQLCSGLHGKRRLGRFPVSSSSVIVKTDSSKAISAVDKHMQEKDTEEDNDIFSGYSFSPLQATSDSFLLCEIEKIESVMNIDRRQDTFSNVEAKKLCKISQVNPVQVTISKEINATEACQGGYSMFSDAKQSCTKLLHHQTSSATTSALPYASPTNSPINKKPKHSSFKAVKKTQKNKVSSKNTSPPNSQSIESFSRNSLNSFDKISKEINELSQVMGKRPNLNQSTNAMKFQCNTIVSTTAEHKTDQNILDENKIISLNSINCKTDTNSLQCKKMESLHFSESSHLYTGSDNLNLTEEKRLLSSWGLPDPVLEVYKKQGINTMFAWQAECLLTGNALAGGNLVYSAPTSAGKTLVAELLVLKKVLETRKKAIVILPFVAVAREKMYQLQNLYQDIGVKVGGYMGSNSPSGGLSQVDIAVCTIEKANGLFNRLMEEGRIAEIGIVVVDELHMVGDSHRGYMLELMLTKLIYLTRKDEDRVQIIGMSATLPNLQLLADWLKASLYFTDCRPVPLTEFIKTENKVLNSDLIVQREIPALLTFPGDQDHVVALCLETVTSGHAVLIFCPTKVWCENLCELVARHFFHILQQQTKNEDQRESCGEITLHLDKKSLQETIEQLKRSPAGVDPMLAKCIINGVAYHHAGLTFDEREIIEGAFRESHLKVLVATSTLSSGVNLPAQRVIIRTPMFHGQVIDSLTYKQMAGRAGRRGVDKFGESILICKAQETIKGQNLLKSALPHVESCLQLATDQGLSNSLKRAVLEIVVSGVATSYEDVLSYIDCSLLSASLNGDDMDKMAVVASCIQYLQENEFITVHTQLGDGNVGEGIEKKKFFSTQLGAAILASSLSPDEGLQAFAELQKARKSFVLDTDLHLIYLVTPVYTPDIASCINWFNYHALWESLSPADRRVAQLVGVSEAFIGRAIKGCIPTKTLTQKKSLGVHQRFFVALILNNLIQETPLIDVATKFNCNKGQLQSLQQSASTYAGMMTVLCGKLGWYSLELLLSHFQKRLSSGVQQELVDLVRIQSLNACSARMLFNAGYQTVADVAKAEVIDVANLFKKAAPFQSEKREDGETDWEQQERNRAKCIWLTGRKGVTEMVAASAIIQEAKNIIQDQLGLPGIYWNSEEAESSDCTDIDANVKTDAHEEMHNKEDDVIMVNDSINSDDTCDNIQHLVINKCTSVSEARRSNTSSLDSSRKLSCDRNTGNLSLTRGLGDMSLNRSTRNTGSVSLICSRNTSDIRRREIRKSFYGHVVVSPPAGLSPPRKSENRPPSSSKANQASDCNEELDNFEESILLDTQTEHLLNQHCNVVIQQSSDSEKNKELINQSQGTSCFRMEKSTDNSNLFTDSFTSNQEVGDSMDAYLIDAKDLNQTESAQHSATVKYTHCKNVKSDVHSKDKLPGGPQLMHDRDSKTVHTQAGLNKYTVSSCLASSACEDGQNISTESLIAASDYDKFEDLDDGVLVDDNSDASQIDDSFTTDLKENCFLTRQKILSSPKSSPFNSYGSPLDENIFLTNIPQLVNVSHTSASHSSVLLSSRDTTQHNRSSLPQYSTPKIIENSRRGIIGKENFNPHSKTLLSQKFKSIEKDDCNNRTNPDEFFMDSFTSSVLDKVQAACDKLIEKNDNLTEENQETDKLAMMELNVTGSDTSDCIPPTPPDDCSKMASPFRCSFHSPLRSARSTPHLSKPISPSGTIQQNLSRKCFTKLKERPKVEHPGDIILTEDAARLQTLKLHRESVQDNKATGDVSEPQISSVSQSLTQQSFTIIDVCAHKDLFEIFLKEWSTQSYYALSIACVKSPPELQKNSGPNIGGKFLRKSKMTDEIGSEVLNGLPVPDSSSLLIGLAVSWENRDSYYISFMPNAYRGDIDVNDTLSEPDIDSHLTQNFRIESVCRVLESLAANKQHKLAIYDAKTVYKYLAKTLGLSVLNCEDPRIADWLREPTSRLKNLHRMVASHCPEELALLDCIGGMQGYQSFGTDIKSQVSARVRACTESVLTMKLMNRFTSLLKEDHLLCAFTDIEMPSLITLARMELNGFG